MYKLSGAIQRMGSAPCNKEEDLVFVTIFIGTTPHDYAAEATLNIDFTLLFCS